MARCATLKSDYPDALFSDDDSSFPLPSKVIESATLGEGERELIARATTEFREDLRSQLESILLDFGARREELAELPLSKMKSEVEKREVPAELQGARKQISRERAGLERVLPPRTPTEKFERVMGNLGNAYESKLAGVLGENRAAELRYAADGWSTRSVVSGQCEPTSDGAK